jgi:hypothetical protein
MKRILSATLLLFTTAVPAQAREPLYVKNLSPVIGLIGLPTQRNAFTTERGRVDVAIHNSIASHYIRDSSSDEGLNLDGETLRFALDLRYGIAQNLDIQLELPWLDHSGGNLDRAIEDWHDFWGMSDGGRSDIERDLMDYRYARGDSSFGLEDDASGLGDLNLSLNYAFYRKEDSAVAVAIGYKFATGDADDFTGSGADDAWIAVRFSGDHLSDLPLVWHGHAGYLYAGDGDLIEDYQENNLWFAGLSLEWRFGQHWSALAQFDSNAAPLKSDIAAVGDEAYIASAGLRRTFGKNWSADFSVVEDIGVETAPDVTFQFSVRYSPEGSDKRVSQR